MQKPNRKLLPVYTYFYVEPNKNCGGKLPCYRTIQDAIDDAISDTFLRVAMGTYNENPTLDKSIEITIEGGWDTEFKNEKSGITKIKAPIVRSGASMIFLELKILP